MIRRIVLAVLLFILPASAANATAVCTLSGSGVDFGEFIGFTKTNIGSIVIRCEGSGTFNYSMTLNRGSSFTFRPREMRNGGETLDYNLYLDPNFFIVWGDGFEGTGIVLGTIHLPSFGTGIYITVVPVYGKLPGQFLPAPGFYSDTIIATMFYFGAPATTSFTVTASETPHCDIHATNLPFTSYQERQLDGQSSIFVNCTGRTIWDLGLSEGTSPGATVTTRQMSGPGLALLPYALYRNPARTLNWGNTVGVDTLAGTGTGNTQIISVYGRIPDGLTPPGGAYRDTITATLTF